MNKNITAIVLTKDEELHIERCIKNLQQVCSKVYVVDSFSTDNTCQIAEQCGAEVLKHEYVNQAQQFQWALDNCPVETEWVMRMDADEYLTDELMREIRETTPNLTADITGVYFKFRVRFLGHTMRFGMLRPVRILRMWRAGSVYMEQRWMDERLVLKEGKAVDFKRRFIDENLNGLTAWTQKHNNYSNREILVELDKRFHLFDSGEAAELKGRNQQKSLYYKLPRFFRAMAYFLARYVLFLGFLDGVKGFVWLTLQAYWYRFLVDAKLMEIEHRLGENPTREEVKEYVRRNFRIKIDDNDNADDNAGRSGYEGF